jgi:hypothetical protein
MNGTPVVIPRIDWTPTGNPLAPARIGYGLTPPATGKERKADGFQ